MSSHYTTEPPPTATALLHTTAGPITLSLFAAQTPLTCRNFLQHVLDGYYDSTLFHRVVSGFVIQAGDPTGTGEGGENIYEQSAAFEKYDAEWARLMKKEVGEKIVFGDEGHSRLKFNRRGLVGMAKSDSGGGYGSQFFITLGDCRAELDGRCTMFGRVEGEGIYNVVKVAEGEVVEGTERPMYPFRITGVEVLEMPKGDAWSGMKAREKVVRTAEEERPKKKKAGGAKRKAGKSLLSFGDEGEEDGVDVKLKRAKFNTNLVSDGGNGVVSKQPVKTNGTSAPKSLQANRRIDDVQDLSRGIQSSIPSHRRQKSLSPSISVSHAKSAEPHRRKPSFHDTTTQLPLKDPESPSDSPTSSPQPADRHPRASASTLNAEIAALKASMRRDVVSAPEAKKRASALDQMIPATSIRGRKRPRPGDAGAGTGDASTLKILNAFRAKLESGDGNSDAPARKLTSVRDTTQTNKESQPDAERPAPEDTNENDDDEATLCDLHFIANCQSCRNWERDNDAVEHGGEADEDDHKDPAAAASEGSDWMKHALSFAKDRLGKDLTWKRKNEEELVVIDPREREKEIKAQGRMERDRERVRKAGKVK